MTSKEFGKLLQDKLTSEYGVELECCFQPADLPLSGSDLPPDDE